MRAALALISIAAVAALAGCGGSSSAGAKSRYEHQMAAVVPGLQGQMLKRRFALEETRVPVLGRRLLLLTENELRAGIAKVSAVKAPAEVASEQAKLVAGYRAELDELKALERLSTGQATDQLRVAAAKLSSGAGEHEVAAALEAIIAKGYDLGFNSAS